MRFFVTENKYREELKKEVDKRFEKELEKQLRKRYEAQFEGYKKVIRNYEKTLGDVYKELNEKMDKIVECKNITEARKVAKASKVVFLGEVYDFGTDEPTNRV